MKKKVMVFYYSTFLKQLCSLNADTAATMSFNDHSSEVESNDNHEGGNDS